MRILVLRGGALGDFIVTLPALRLLRERWPDARIELAGNATAAELALRAGVIDAAHSQHEARWAQLYAAGPLAPEFAAWLAHFDLAINFWPDADGALARHFPRNAAQRFLSGPAHPTTHAPAARHFCETLRALNVATDDFRGRLRFAETRTRAIALHPGSGSPSKNWPLPHWRELCAQLRAQHPDSPLLIVGGEADGPAVEALAPFGAKLFGQPLPSVARHLAGCGLFVGHDSGVGHLAAAVETPCVLLFGPTDPALWAPPGAHVHVLRRGPDPATIEPRHVLEKIAPLLRSR